jgi:hypothetical protein
MKVNIDIIASKQVWLVGLWYPLEPNNDPTLTCPMSIYIPALSADKMSSSLTTEKSLCSLSQILNSSWKLMYCHCLFSALKVQEEIIVLLATSLTLLFMIQQISPDWVSQHVFDQYSNMPDVHLYSCSFRW